MSDSEKKVLKEMLPELQKKYEELKNNPKNLDITRGKPSSEQLDLSNPMLNILGENDFINREGIDCRNYFGIDGIIEMREIFADMLAIPVEKVIAGGNSSLNMMFDLLATFMLKGTEDCEPWTKQGKIKFLCPSPGYDRHFAICEFFGIEMIQIPIFDEGLEIGPDMDLIEELVESDENIKGIWCVPKYANPNGVTYSDEVVKRFAALKSKAKDFKIIWDNAYALHDLYEDDKENLLNIIDECEKAGNPDLVYVFTSFSKISYGGSGVGCVAGSIKNLDYIRKRVAIQTVGPNKINQLQHAKFFENIDGVKEQLKKHAEFLRPRFELVMDILNRELKDYDICKWNDPKGGYFISFDSLPGLAEKIVEYCGDCGLKLNPAGSTFPYKQDPYGNNIRIAPSYPSIEDLEEAIEIFCLCVKLASAQW